MNEQKRWFFLIDGIRGIAVLNMVLFHFLYDLFMIYGLDTHWYFNPLVHIWQRFICFTFIFISGMAWNLSHNHWYRGILLNFFGMVITFITVIFAPDSAVWFGILNFLGCAILLSIPVKHLCAKLNPYVGFFIALLAFFIFSPIENGYIGLDNMQWLTLPKWLYQIKLFTFLGFPYDGFASSDFFPILPWFFLFQAGYWFWKIAYKHEACIKILEFKIPIFSKVGRRSIWIYLIHQPLSMLLCEALFAVNILN